MLTFALKFHGPNRFVAAPSIMMCGLVSTCIMCAIVGRWWWYRNSCARALDDGGDIILRDIFSTGEYMVVLYIHAVLFVSVFKFACLVWVTNARV